jgi:glycosyltransferase involved in cell wall biosynthesis
MSFQAMDLSSNSKITTVIPFYKSDNTVYDTLLSIQKQSVAPRQVLIINDGSPKESEINLKEIIRTFNFPITLINLPSNLGLGALRFFVLNNLVETYNIEILHMLDADDIIHKDFYLMVSKFEFKNNTVLTFNFISFYNIKEVSFKKKNVNFNLRKIHNALLTGSCSKTVFMLKDKKPLSILEKIEAVRANYEDWYLFAALQSIGFDFYRNTSVLCGYRRVPTYGSSMSYRVVPMKEMKSVAYKISSINKSRYFFVLFLLFISELNKYKRFIANFLLHS